MEGLINNISLMMRNSKKEIWISLNNGISIFDIDLKNFKTLSLILEQKINYLMDFHL